MNVTKKSTHYATKTVNAVLPIEDNKPKSFFGVKHTYGDQILLTKEFTRIETPKQLNVELRPHQATIVQAMIDIASRQVIDIRGDKLRSQALVLSEPFGSGKTFEILALIAAYKCPNAFPQSIRVNNLEVWRTFTGSALIEPALIVVASGVLKQWEKTITTYTTLKYLTVDDVFDVREFVKLGAGINNYDIILLKNGNVTGSFLLPGETAETNKDFRSLIYVMRELTKNKCWSWVVYDDFDTIKIPVNTQTINSLFTIFVSASRKQEYIRDRPKTNIYPDFASALRNYTCDIVRVASDDILFTNFNVHNEASFTEESTQITLINAFKYVFKNRADTYMGLLNAMDDTEATKILEMLNGDAINTAAAELGIVSNSYADIFQRVLDKHYTAHMRAKSILKAVNNAITIHGKLAPHESAKEHTISDIDSITVTLESSGSPSLTYYSSQLQIALADLKIKWTKMVESSGRPIERVKENIKSGDCQICCLPLNEFDVFIIRCCGIVVCDLCGIKGNHIGLKPDPTTGKMAVFGNCANCTKIVDPRKDLIFVDKNFDIEKLISANGDEAAEETVKIKISEPIPEIKEVEAFNEIENLKVRAFMKICKGIDQEKTSINLRVTHLLIGVKDEKYNGTVLKILLFANYGETLDLYMTAMKKYNINHAVFNGNPTEKANHIKKFTNSTETCVLLINSQQSCAGMHLACCTDIIMTGIVHDDAISGQIIGRGQRIGRTHNLRVHYLLYENERGEV